ncbi:MAG: tetratricopeptide repeat protein [Ignavibacteria bacterium]
MVVQKTGDDSLSFITAASKLKAAVAFESAGKYESAITSLDQAIEFQNDYVDAWLIKGIILSKLGKCSEALQCYDKVIDLDVNCPDAWRLKAAIYTSQNQYQKAVECLEKAVELNPNSLEFRLKLGEAFQRLKRFEDALKCYAQAKMQIPNDPRIDYYIGVMWGNMADYDKALASFEIALRLKPDFTDAMLGKGIMLAKLGRTEEAKECANKILEIRGTTKQEKPDSAKSLNNSIRDDWNLAQKKFKAQYSTTK